jgi:hypothetical protein
MKCVDPRRAFAGVGVAADRGHCSPSAVVIDKARSHAADSWFVVWGMWAIVVLAVVGVLFALATVRSWGRVMPGWLILGPLWIVSVLMVLRAVLVGLGDVQRLTAGASTYTALWDLALWSPYFLVWGLRWGATARAYNRRSTVAPDHPAPHTVWAPHRQP